MKGEQLRTKSLDEMIDKHIGEVGTEKREAFEEELRLDVLGQMQEVYGEASALRVVAKPYRTFKTRQN